MLRVVNDLPIAGDVARSPPAAIRDDFSRILEGGRPEKLGPLLHPDAVAAQRYWSWQLMQQLDVMRVFPMLFSLTCLVMFSMPIGIAYHLGLDEDVRYWGDGPMCGTALWLPWIFILAFYVHDRLQRPHKDTWIAANMIGFKQARQFALQRFCQGFPMIATLPLTSGGWKTLGKLPSRCTWTACNRRRHRTT